VVAVILSAVSSRDNDFRALTPVGVLIFLPNGCCEDEGNELATSERGLVETGCSSRLQPAADGLAALSLAAADRGDVSSDDEISLHCTVLSSSLSF
jgi:hypothetical protein